MTKDNRTITADGGEKARKPYSKPACQSEEIFEVTALACGKVPGQSANCNSSPSAS
jgi:hypothetical protein